MIRATPNIYQDVLALIRNGQDRGDAEDAISRILELGFMVATPTDAKFEKGYTRQEGYDTVFVQYRDYDTSGPFQKSA